MESLTIYQQDTTRIDISLKNIRNVHEPGSLRVGTGTLSTIEPIPVRDTTQQPSVTAAQDTPGPPTTSQIRYWWWQREKKLTVGGSRYIAPRGEVELYTEKEIPHQGLDLPGRLMIRSSNDWLTMVLLFLLVLLAIIRTSRTRFMGQIFQSLFNYSAAYRMYRERNYSFLHTATGLDIFFFLVFSIFLFQLTRFNFFEVPYRNFLLYLLIAGGVFAFFYAKKLLYRFVGLLFETKSETDEFLFNMDNFKRATGLILFPVVAIIAFSPFVNLYVSVIIGALFIIINYLLLLFRGFVILFRKQFSILYLFLYFCTLEFLPLVLVYKILVI